MIIECELCKRDFENKIIDDQRISGGICGNCVSGDAFHIGIPLFEYLETINLPVILVDSNVVILYANKAALIFLNKCDYEVNNHIGGDVFECKYAHLPGGCGKTIHCSGCTIRNAVTETYTHKKMLINAPAVLTQKEVFSCTDIDMMISTEMAGDVVMLRIDTVILCEKTLSM